MYEGLDGGGGLVTGTWPTTCLHVKYHLKRIWACPAIYYRMCMVLLYTNAK